MCVIVHMPKNRQIKKEYLRNCYENNPDGYGIMTAENNKLVIIKGVGNFDAFWKDWQEVPPNLQRAIHFRWKTHGLINTENCHPFPIGEGIGMMHNGIIRIDETNKDMSDTWHFAETRMKPLIEKYPDAMQFEKELKECVEPETAGSRLLFMDHAGRVVKTALATWHKEFGVYFSNGHSHSAGRRVRTYRTTWDYGNDGYDFYNTYNNGRSHGGYTPVPSESGKVYDDTRPYGREAVETGNEYEPYDLNAPTMDQLYEMSEGDMLDWVDSHPEDATDLIRELLGVDAKVRRDEVTEEKAKDLLSAAGQATACAD